MRSMFLVKTIKCLGKLLMMDTSLKLRNVSRYREFGLEDIARGPHMLYLSGKYIKLRNLFEDS